MEILPEGERNRLADFFRLFASPSRLLILLRLALKSQGLDELSKGLIVSPGSDLRILRVAELIRHRDGNRRIYELTPSARVAVEAILDSGGEHIKEHVLHQGR